MTKQKARKIFMCLQHENPKPKIELQYKTSFELLIAVVLSAQTKDTSVNEITKKLFPLANTPEKIYALGEEKLKKHIKTIGLYNNKAANIIKTCRILIDKYHSKAPNDAKDLESLPGVGHKSTNVILNTAFGQPAIAVDTHVFRVSNRTGLAPGKNVKIVEEELEKIIPNEFKQYASHWLVLHGRYTCTAKKPKCKTCCIQSLCEYKNKNL